MSTSPASDEGALYGRTWYLVSVTGDGRTWVPMTWRPPSLVFHHGATATTDDAANTTEWQAAIDSDTITWVEGMSTAAGETEPSLQVYDAVSRVLDGRVGWRLDDGRLVLTGRFGTTLTYATTPLLVPTSTTGLGVFLNAGHIPQPGEMDQFLPGQVTIRDSSGAVVWHGQVTVDDDGEQALPPGPYQVSAVVAAGVCTPRPVTVGKDGFSELTLACPAS
jgi:META domain